MPKQKQIRRTSITLDVAIDETIKKMVRYHQTGSVSDYIRGLVMLDLLLINGRAEHEAVPKWLLRGYPLTFLAEARGALLKEWEANSFGKRILFGKEIRARMQQLIKEGKVDLTTKEVPTFESDIDEESR
jgi:hypothetical protein